MKKIECPFCGTVNVFYPKPYEFHMVNGWRKAVRRGKCECCGFRFEYYFHDGKPYYLPAGWMDGDPKIPAYIRQKGDGELNCPVCHENFNHGIHAHKIKERTIVNHKHPQANPKMVDIYGKRCRNCDTEFEYYYDPWEKEFKYYKKIDAKNRCRDCKYLAIENECNGRGSGKCLLANVRNGSTGREFSRPACRYFEQRPVEENPEAIRIVNNLKKIGYDKASEFISTITKPKKEEEIMGPDKLDLDFKIYYAPELSIPGVERIKFNGPATIIFWKDGTKTVVKCQEGDEYDSEKGVLFCVLKKLIGLNKINHILELAEIAAEEELSRAEDKEWGTIEERLRTLGEEPNG